MFCCEIGDCEAYSDWTECYDDVLGDDYSLDELAILVLEAGVECCDELSSLVSIEKSLDGRPVLVVLETEVDDVLVPAGDPDGVCPMTELWVGIVDMDLDDYSSLLPKRCSRAMICACRSDFCRSLASILLPDF